MEIKVAGKKVHHINKGDQRVTYFYEEEEAAAAGDTSEEVICDSGISITYT